MKNLLSNVKRWKTFQISLKWTSTKIDNAISWHLRKLKLPFKKHTQKKNRKLRDRKERQTGNFEIKNNSANINLKSYHF